MKLPSGIAACLWSYDVGRLDLERDRDNVITQVLNFGGLKEVQWLLRRYPRRDIARVIQQPSRGSWLPRVLYFWTSIWKIRIPKKTYQAALLNIHPH